MSRLSRVAFSGWGRGCHGSRSVHGVCLGVMLLRHTRACTHTHMHIHVAIGNILDCRIINRKHQKTVVPPWDSILLIFALHPLLIGATPRRWLEPLLPLSPTDPWSLIEGLCLTLFISIAIVTMLGVGGCHGDETGMAGVLNETWVARANEVGRLWLGVFFDCDDRQTAC